MLWSKNMGKMKRQGVTDAVLTVQCNARQTSSQSSDLYTITKAVVQPCAGAAPDVCPLTF